MLALALLCLAAYAKFGLCEWPYGSAFAYWMWQSGEEFLRSTSALARFWFQG
jgi:hypothetical protein